MDATRLASTSTQELQLTEGKKGESIFNFYSIPNEVSFLKKVKGISSEDERFYLRENVLRFFGEFVGKVPYTKISYKVKNGDLFFADMQVMRTYKETAEMTERGSREWAEYEGMDKVRKGLAYDEISSAFMISPSKIADYGLGFYFKKRGDTIDEYILRYKEGLGMTSVSSRIQTGITKKPTFYTSANEFIANPLFFSTDTSWAQILNLPEVGIDMASIEKSQLFEKRIEQELGGWIDEYANEVRRLALYDSDSPAYKEKEESVKILFVALFNMAQAIKDDIDKPGTSVPSVFYDGDPEAIRYFYNREEEPLITGGGSCAVTTRSNGRHGFLSSHDIHSLMKDGKTAESEFTGEKAKDDPNLCRCHASSEPHFHCPGANETCRHAIDVGKGITKCPSCGEGARC